MLSVQELIAGWREEKVQVGDLVEIVDEICSDGVECWMPSLPFSIEGDPTRENSVQVIKDLEALLGKLRTLVDEEGRLPWHFEQAIIRGTVCEPSRPGYPVAIKDIEELFIYCRERMYLFENREEGPHCVTSYKGEDGKIYLREL